MKIEIIFVFLLISSIFSTESPTFTASAIATGTCTSGSYTFKVNGELSAATATAITITPTFTSLSAAPTVTCSLPASTVENLSTAAIECTITSALNGDTFAISAMTGTGVTVSGLPKTMTGTATCAGKSEEKKNDYSDGSDDDAKFIQLSKF